MNETRISDGDNPALSETKFPPTKPYVADAAPDYDPSYDPDRDPTVRAIGVMGAAGGFIDPKARERAYRLGTAVAKAGIALITGACPGLPYEAARGAKDAGGLSIGISPALSRSEHVKKYQSPVKPFDAIIYTGSGLMGREVHNIHSSDIVIIAGGRSGTLGEFSIAFDEGRLIGVLTQTGGIADEISAIVKMIDKDTGAALIYDHDPERLVQRCIEQYRTAHFTHPSTFMQVGKPEDGTWPESPSSAPQAS